jgi:hypothetical protein
VSIDHEATSVEQGVLHSEHSLLVPGPEGRDRLYIAQAESPYVTEMIESESESGRFHQPTPFGPYTLEVVIEVPEPGQVTYAWWWAPAGEPPIEQSKASASLVT